MSGIHSIYIRSIKIILYCLLSCLLLSCASPTDPFDRQTGATKKDITDAIFRKKRGKEEADKKSIIENTIPQSSRMIVIPTPPKTKQQQLISFAVTEEVPLKDILIELAKVSKMDLNLDPEIGGGIIIDAKNRPITEILDRICKMGNLRYSIIDNVLHIERDLAYPKTYTANFLIDGEIWQEVEDNLISILNSTSSGSYSASVSSNKLANIMTVFASKEGHRKAEEYLRHAKLSATAQVLIEAKVVEITLNDTYKTGINWTWVGGSGNTTVKGSGGYNESDALSFVLGPKGIFGGNINSSISALEEFGVVKAIASPRINALNNQEATLNFTKKLVYFVNEVESNTTTTSGTSNTQNTVTSTKNEEETGTELTITPSIDLKNGEITLNVVPKITIKTDDVTQTVSYTDAGGNNQTLDSLIPIVNTRELSTVAKVKSGNILVIGGVMTEDTTNKDSGIPFLSKIPIMGALFRSTSKVSAVTETVIFIKATIINPGDPIDQYDKKLNNEFTSSDRPF